MCLIIYTLLQLVCSPFVADEDAQHAVEGADDSRYVSQAQLDFTAMNSALYEEKVSQGNLVS